MDTTAAIALALAATGLSVLAVVRLYRAKQFTDEITDSDTRTATLASLIYGEGETAREGAAGGGCAKAGRFYSLHSHTRSGSGLGTGAK